MRRSSVTSAVTSAAHLEVSLCAGMPSRLFSLCCAFCCAFRCAFWQAALHKQQQQLDAAAQQQARLSSVAIRVAVSCPPPLRRGQ